MAKNPYGYPEFIKSTGYGTGPGLKGWNCYHDFHPFIPGVDTPNYTEEEVAQMNAEDNVPRKFGDKEYNAYEATQRQRELERVMRKYGEETHLLELGGADDDTVLATKVRYQTASQEYAAFSKAMGLPQQRERIRNGMDSLAQYAQTAQKPLDFSLESGIMKSIDVDDYNVMVQGKNIDKKVSDAILSEMQSVEKNAKIYYSDVLFTEIADNQDGGHPALQTEMLQNGLLRLNVNTSVFAGKTIEQVNEMFLKSDLSLADNLHEAIIHESGHAKYMRGKKPINVQKIHEDLEKIHIDGISVYAFSDGAECIAEVEVLLSRGKSVSEEAMKLYRKYVLVEE